MAMSTWATLDASLSLHLLTGHSLSLSQLVHQQDHISISMMIFPFYMYSLYSKWACLTPFRCYMTLTTALHLCRGGCPKGPAGTGKTETVKDLGKALGMHVIVVNCSERLDYKSIGRMFSGLAQVGKKRDYAGD